MNNQLEKHFGFVFREASERSQAIVARDLEALSQSYTRSYGFVASHGKGAEVWDVDGYRYIDLAAGIAVLSTGFSHPHIVKTIQEQAERLIHVGGTDFFYEAQVRLAERLQQIIPIHRAVSPKDKRTFFANSGTESIEAAMKLARYRGGNNSRRKIIIAFYGAFHGRTYGALSLTSSKPVQRADYPYLPGGVVHVPYPGQFRYEHSRHKSSIEFDTRRFLETYVFRQTSPSEIAAVIVEPIQGEGGYILPRDNFLPDLRKICDEHGILLIVDEVQSGMGRTGRWLACEHWGVEPDIVCLAKGLGSGMPIGAIVAHHDVMNIWEPGAHANTFGGNLLACEAATATIDIIERENLLDHAAEMGEAALLYLHEVQREFPHIIHRVEGKGLMIGVEFARRDGAPLTAFRNDLEIRCFLNGLLVLGCGTSTIRIAPSLIISREHLMEGLRIFRDSIGQMLRHEVDTQPAAQALHCPRVLIIENESAIRRIIARSVEKALGASVIEEAPDFATAMEKLSQGVNHYDLITWDNRLNNGHTAGQGVDLMPLLDEHHHQNGTIIIGVSGALQMRDFRLLIRNSLTDLIDRNDGGWPEMLEEAIRGAFTERSW